MVSKSNMASSIFCMRASVQCLQRVTAQFRALLEAGADVPGSMSEHRLCAILVHMQTVSWSSSAKNLFTSQGSVSRSRVTHSLLNILSVRHLWHNLVQARYLWRGNQLIPQELHPLESKSINTQAKWILNRYMSPELTEKRLYLSWRSYISCPEYLLYSGSVCIMTYLWFQIPTAPIHKEIAVHTTEVLPCTQECTVLHHQFPHNAKFLYYGSLTTCGCWYSDVTIRSSFLRFGSLMRRWSTRS